jgi:hypothetical protein
MFKKIIKHRPNNSSKNPKPLIELFVIKLLNFVIPIAITILSNGYYFARY